MNYKDKIYQLTIIDRNTEHRHYYWLTTKELSDSINKGILSQYRIEVL